MADPVQSAIESLQQLGIAPGKRIAIWAENSPAVAATIAALWRMGCSAVMLPPYWGAAQVSELVAGNQVEVLLTERPDTDLEVESCSLRGIIDCQENAIEFTPLPTKADLSREASVLFSSGSTGRPKGVVHTVGNHYYSAVGSSENIPFQREDCWLVSLPMYHISGLSLVMRALVGGAKLCFPRQGESLVQALRRYPVTHVSLVPSQLHNLMRDEDGIAALRSLKAVLIGGAAVSEGLVRRSHDCGIRIYTSYGSSEMGSQVCTTAVTDSYHSSGHLLPHRELQIADDGEILVRGKTLCQGYLTDGKIVPIVAADGWFHTGDMGNLDEEGNLHVFGRKDSMFTCGGINLFPEQLESLIAEHPDVARVAVVPKPSEQFGSVPVAFLQMDNAQLPSHTELKQFLDGRISPYVVPKDIRELPQEVGGLKVSRGKLSARLSHEISVGVVKQTASGSGRFVV